MTTKQLRREQAHKRAAMKREKRGRRKAREEAHRLKRAERRAAKAAPKKSYASWSKDILSAGCCAVCGYKPGPKIDPKTGAPKLTNPKDRVKKDGTVIKGKPRTVIVHLNAHHLLPKERYPEFKFERINGICLCPLHHKFDKFSAHRNPIWFVEWLKVNRPEQYAWCMEKLLADPATVRLGGIGVPDGVLIQSAGQTDGRPAGGVLGGAEDSNRSLQAQPGAVADHPAGGAPPVEGAVRSRGLGDQEGPRVMPHPLVGNWVSKRVKGKPLSEAILQAINFSDQVQVELSPTRSTKAEHIFVEDGLNYLRHNKDGGPKTLIPEGAVVWWLED